MAKKTESTSGLTDQQEMFCREYLIDFNGKRAYQSAYPEVTDESAASAAWRLLRNVNVQSYLATLGKDRIERLEVKSDEILLELQRLGYSDIRKIFDEAGAVLPMKEWPEDIARAVSAIEVDETYQFHPHGFYCRECGRQASKELTGQVRKFKLWGKTHSLEMLAKNKKLLTDKVDLNAKVTLEDLVGGGEKKPEDES